MAFQRTKRAWSCCQDFAKRNREAFHKAHHAAHLTYFALVATKGPYYWLAGLCFAIGSLAWIMGIDIEEHSDHDTQD